MQHVMQIDDVRDLAINCTDALIDKGLVPTLDESGEQSCWEAQDTIEEVLTRLLKERHNITLVNERVKTEEQ